MTYTYHMIIAEPPIFTKQLLSNLSDEEYRLFQATLLERPDAGKVIPGGGGLRKVRWGLEGRGKSGGARIIYYCVYRERYYSSVVHVSQKRAGESYTRPT